MRVAEVGKRVIVVVAVFVPHEGQIPPIDPVFVEVRLLSVAIYDYSCVIQQRTADVTGTNTRERRKRRCC